MLAVVSRALEASKSVRMGITCSVSAGEHELTLFIYHLLHAV